VIYIFLALRTQKIVMKTQQIHSNNVQKVWAI